MGRIRPSGTYSEGKNKNEDGCASEKIVFHDVLHLNLVTLRRANAAGPV